MTTGTLQRIFDDLLTLEVNVILKEAMTGRKMPDARSALLDIAGYYDGFLVTASACLDQPYESISGTPIHCESFEALRRAACVCEGALLAAPSDAAALDPGDGVVLKRIYRNCYQLEQILGRSRIRSQTGAGFEEGMVDARAPFSLTADEMLTIRKIWEVGTEQIVMQTVVQLDGDVVTRIQRNRNTAATAAMHELHREGVDNALSHWQFMFTTVAELTGKAFNAFLGR